MKGKHYKTVCGGYTEWKYKNGIIRLDDGTSRYEILHYVIGMDGNSHRVFWHTSTFDDAIAYLDNNQDY